MMTTMTSFLKFLVLYQFVDKKNLYCTQHTCGIKSLWEKSWNISNGRKELLTDREVNSCNRRVVRIHFLNIPPGALSLFLLHHYATFKNLSLNSITNINSWKKKKLLKATHISLLVLVPNMASTNSKKKFLKIQF